MRNLRFNDLRISFYKLGYTKKAVTYYGHGLKNVATIVVSVHAFQK